MSAPHDRVRAAVLGCAVIAALVGSLVVVAAVPRQATSPGQVFATPKAHVENVRFAQAPGGLIQITYDLIGDDPKATFSVSLEVSADSGETWTIKPKSVSGDIGASVLPGLGKKITWEAGKDVETMQVDQFRFRVISMAGRATPMAPTTTTRVPPTVVSGRISVKTSPAGATVLVDDQPRGSAPLTIAEVSPGAHQLTIRKEGFLDNSRSVQVRANATEEVAVELTALPASAPPKPIDAARKGNPLKWVVIGAGGAGAAVAAAVAGGGGGSSTTTTTPNTTTTTIGPPTTTTTTSTVPASTFTLSGVVTDDVTNAAIAGAEPEVLAGPNAGKKPVTGANGFYSIPGLAPQTFTLRFRAQNYDNVDRTVVISSSNVTLNVTMHRIVNAVLTVSVSPNPVPFSGAPIGGVCTGSTNTWFYNVTLAETAGSNVTITRIVDRVDGSTVNDFATTLTVPGRGSLNLPYNWCFTPPIARTLQSTYTGTDSSGRSVSITTPAITLRAKP